MGFETLFLTSKLAIITYRKFKKSIPNINKISLIPILLKNSVHLVLVKVCKDIMQLIVKINELTQTEPLYVKFSNNITDRKSTRLNSSHANISYAVFCLKKKIPLPLS